MALCIYVKTIYDLQDEKRLFQVRNNYHEIARKLFSFSSFRMHEQNEESMRLRYVYEFGICVYPSIALLIRIFICFGNCAGFLSAEPFVRCEMKNWKRHTLAYLPVWWCIVHISDSVSSDDELLGWTKNNYLNLLWILSCLKVSDLCHFGLALPLLLFVI